MSNEAGARRGGLGAKTWFILAALVLAETAFAFESAMIYAALPALRVRFDAPSSLAWIMTSYQIVAATSVAVVGRLGDRLGRRRMLIWVLAFSIVGPVVSAASSSLAGVIAGRAIQGVSIAILPLVVGLLREAWPRERQAFGLGVLTSLTTGMATLGIAIGGYLVDGWGWPAIFWAAAIVSVLALVTVLLAIPPGTQARGVMGRMDWLGGALFVLGVGGVFLGLSQAQGWGLRDPRTPALLLGGVVLIVIWFRYELRLSEPLFHVRMLLAPRVALVCLAMALTIASLAMFPVILGHLLQQAPATGMGFGKSATFVGSMFIPSAVLQITLAPLIAWTLQRWGGPPVLVAAALVGTLIWLGLMAWPGSLGLAMLAISVSGTIYSLCYGALTAMLVEGVPTERTSEATGVFQVSRVLGQAVGVQMVFLALASAYLRDGSGAEYPTPSAYVVADLWCVATALAVVLIALLLGRRRPTAAALA